MQLNKEDLSVLGYEIKPDPDQPGLFLWRNKYEGSETSFASESEAIADATRDAFTTYNFHRCDNCHRVHTDETLRVVRHLSERVDPGGIMPSGECEKCGCLCYPFSVAMPPAANALHQDNLRRRLADAESRFMGNGGRGVELAEEIDALRAEIEALEDDDDENPNENCLAGMKCPKCGHYESFRIFVTQARMTEVTDDGLDYVGGDSEWDDTSACECTNCGHEGVVRDFRGEPAPEFDRFQKVVLEAYNDGLVACDSPDDVKSCGDTLLTFLMVELSEKEDCDSVETALRRIDIAIEQIEKVRAAFEGMEGGQ